MDNFIFIACPLIQKRKMDNSPSFYKHLQKNLWSISGKGYLLNQEHIEINTDNIILNETPE